MPQTTRPTDLEQVYREMAELRWDASWLDLACRALVRVLSGRPLSALAITSEVHTQHRGR